MTGRLITLSLPTHVAIRPIQRFTVGWMIVEVMIALIAAIHAHSVALAAFGGDSAIELFSAAVVLARFRATDGVSETLTTTITGWLLVALAAYSAAGALQGCGASNAPGHSHRPCIVALQESSLA